MQSGSAVDTSVMIDYLRGNEHARTLIKDADAIFLPATVLGELLFGVKNSRNRMRDLPKTREFLSHYKSLPITTEVAEIYSNTKAALLSAGSLIPENDIWIAACALANKLPLMTFDQHFSRIEKLEVIG